MELEQCIRERRSIRKFKNAPIEKGAVEKLIAAAQQAPSWKNSQVSRYYAVLSKENKAKIMDCLPEFNRNSAANASALIVTTVIKGRSGFERDGSYTTHLKDGFQYFDNGLQVQNLCLQAYAMGLGTLIMGIYDQQAIRQIAAIPEEQEIVAIIAVGYPDIAPDMPPRKEVDEILRFL